MAKKTYEQKASAASKEGFRPPIVAVLGHVDHGKTSILDFIRKSRLTAKEAGGITQSIGAYQVEVDGKKITFIDTPGHETFFKMRQRGGFSSDLVVLVIAADDGVMPQTKESLEHIKRAKVPFLVAVNKIDLPSANVEKVYDQLEKEKVQVEKRGGKIVSVPCSAKTGEGIKDLLEMIILLGEMLALEANPEGSLEAVVIESKVTRAGPQAAILIKNGTLRVGDLIVVEGYQAKVKALLAEDGKRLLEAGPSMPVSVLGFSQAPPVGVKVLQVEALLRQDKTLPKPPASLPAEAGEDKFKIILKADSLGSLEAVQDSLPEEVYLLKKEVGDITESDVMQANTSQAIIFGFRVKLSPQVKKLAEEQKVKVKTYQIIYELLEELKEEILAAGEEEAEEVFAKAEIIAEFPYGEGRIAGCQVLQGRITQKDTLSLIRDGEVLGKVKISSMRHENEDVKVAEKDSQFGAILKGKVDFKIGDMLISARR